MSRLDILRPLDGLIDSGVTHYEGGRYLDAIAHLVAAAELDPSDSRPHGNLSACYSRLGLHEESERAAREAIRLAPQVSPAWNNLGVALKALGRYGEAIAAHEEALWLDPDNKVAEANLAMALELDGRPYWAAAAWGRFLRRNPDDVDARLALGMNQLAAGIWEFGWKNYDARLNRPPCVTRLSQDIPLWDGSPLDGTLLLCSTDGFGDAVMGIRHAQECKRRCREVVVRCAKPLGRLMARIEGVDRVVSMDDPFPAADAQHSIHSLPGVIGRPGPDGSMVPYLSAAPDDVIRWREGFAEVYDRSIKVGVVWQGDPSHGDDKRRSFRLEMLAPLADVPGVRIISLQKGRGSDQGFESNVVDLDLVTEWPSYRDGDYLETAAAISACDLIIACDTGMAHLAGALGKPVWLALCKAGEWRWMLGREDSPWYPTLRIFRQPTPGDWAAVFGRMAEEIRILSGS